MLLPGSEAQQPCSYCPQPQVSWDSVVFYARLGTVWGMGSLYRLVKPIVVALVLSPLLPPNQGGSGCDLSSPELRS